MTTDERIIKAYESSASVRQVARKLGLSNSGLRKRLKRLGLDTKLGTSNCYTKELLAPIVRESKTFADVCRAVGVRPHGGTQAHIKRRCDYFGVDYSHFLGRQWALGKTRPITKQAATDVLRLRRKGNRRRGSTLRKALLAIGRREECSECGQDSIWNGRELHLPVDHINGNILDDRSKNLRFMCPNCHSQTSTYAGRNIGR